MNWANTGSTSDIVPHRQKDIVKPRLNLAYFWEQGCQISNYYTPFKYWTHEYTGPLEEGDSKVS